MEKDEFFIKRIRELANLSYQRDIVTFLDFLNLNEQNIVNDRKNQIPGVEIECFGGYSQAERQMMAFHSDALAFPWEYPITCLKIQPKAVRFSEELTHRDYLGALMNLGISRTKTGDIIVQDKQAYLIVSESIADYICENLTRIRHTSVMCRQIDWQEFDYKPQVKEVMGSIASVRLDAVIGLAFSQSRSKLTGYISEEKVQVNGKVITSNAYNLKENDLISVRGLGKFRYKGTSAVTKKGRLMASVEVFV